MRTLDARGASRLGLQRDPLRFMSPRHAAPTNQRDSTMAIVIHYCAA
jgi:hypothetical protein